MGHYAPLTWMSLGLDYEWWGMEAFGYHLTNLLLHAANVALVYLVARRLMMIAGLGTAAEENTALRAGAALAALLFGLHPLRVESVAWISERRDVLSGLFYLSAILAYLRAFRSPAARQGWSHAWWWTCLGFFVLALLSKSIVVTLPVILVLLDVYPLRRLGGRPDGWFGRDARSAWLEKIPFFVLGLAAAAIALFQGISGKLLVSPQTLSLPKRVAITLYGLGFYLWKTLVPLNLAALYELRPERLDPLAWPFLLSDAVVLGISLACVLLRRRCPALLTAWLACVVTLLPVSGLFQNGPQIAADRYTYLSCLGWAVLAGAGALTLWRQCRSRQMRSQAFVLAGVAFLAVGGLGALTWKQTQVWRDPETLWTHAVSVSPGSFAHENLGVALAERGDLSGAAKHLRVALALDPGSYIGHTNFGAVLIRQGATEEAIAHFRQALRIKPDYDVAHNDLGVALMNHGEMAEAIVQFRLALQGNPKYREARSNLARALEVKGASAD